MTYIVWYIKSKNDPDREHFTSRASQLAVCLLIKIINQLTILLRSMKLQLRKCMNYADDIFTDQGFIEVKYSKTILTNFINHTMISIVRNKNLDILTIIA